MTLFDLFKSKWTTYFGMVVALLAIIAGTFGWFDPNIAWSVASLFGFGSIASLAAYISDKGWKTYVLAVFSVIPAILLVLKVITPEIFATLIGIGCTLAGVTLQMRAVKVNGK